MRIFVVDLQKLIEIRFFDNTVDIQWKSAILEATNEFFAFRAF